MAAMVPFAAKGAANASQTASKALTGDIYTRKWQTVKTTGKGKKKQKIAVDHEVHVNPLTGAVGVLVLGAAATAGMMALWFSQKKLTNTVPEGGAKMWRLVRLYDPQTKVVVDAAAVPAVAAWTEYRTGTAPNYIKVRVDKNGFEQAEAAAFGVHWVFDHIEERYAGEKTTTYSVYHDVEPGTPAVTHLESLGSRTVVQTLRGLPIRTYVGGSSLSEAEMLSERERALGWTTDTVESVEDKEDRTGKYRLNRVRFKNPSKKRLGVGEREGFGINIGGGSLF